MAVADREIRARHPDGRNSELPAVISLIVQVPHDAGSLDCDWRRSSAGAQRRTPEFGPTIVRVPRIRR